LAQALDAKTQNLKSKRDQGWSEANARALNKLKKLNGEVISIHQLVEQSPSQFKNVIDRLTKFSQQKESSESKAISSRSNRNRQRSVDSQS